MREGTLQDLVDVGVIIRGQGDGIAVFDRMVLTFGQ